MAKWLKVIITFINNLKHAKKEQREGGSWLDNIRIQKISAELRNVKNMQYNKKARYYSWKVKYMHIHWEEMIFQHNQIKSPMLAHTVMQLKKKYWFMDS